MYGFSFVLLYSGKVWMRNVSRIWQIVHDSIAKLKPSKLVLTIYNLLADLLIRQPFFCQMLERVNSPNFPPQTFMVYGMLNSYVYPYVHYVFFVLLFRTNFFTTKRKGRWLWLSGKQKQLFYCKCLSAVSKKQWLKRLSQTLCSVTLCTPSDKYTYLWEIWITYKYINLWYKTTWFLGNKSNIKELILVY